MGTLEKSGMAITPGSPADRTNFYQHEAETGSYLSPAYNQDVMKELLSALPRESPRRVCDLGSGVGSNLPTLTAMFPRARIFSLDLSQTALIEGFRTTASVMPAQADATAIPLTNECIDLLVCTEVLEHVGDLGRAFSEIARVVRRGGYAAISSPNYLNPMGLRKWFNDRRRGESFWDPWGGHPGFERLMLPATVARAMRPFFDAERVLGAGYVMGWIPLGYRRIGPWSDGHPFRAVGRIPVLRNFVINRYLLLRRK